METNAHQQGTIIWKYWEGPKPDYIKIIDNQTIKYTSHPLIITTPETIENYIDIPNNVWNLQKPAHRADIFRARLLYKYGGLWLDSDALLVNNIDFLFDYLNNHELVGFVENGSRKRTLIGVLGSQANSPIINHWIKLQNNVISRNRRMSWTGLGADPLSQAIKIHARSKILSLTENLICPFHWTQFDILFSSRYPNEIIQDNTLSVSFYHSQLPSYDFPPNTLGSRLLEKYG